MENRDINHIEQVAGKSRPEPFCFGLARCSSSSASCSIPSPGGGNIMLIVAGTIGGYMAWNIGANDVANNVGPAVGLRVLSLGGALVIAAAIFEAAGALDAGGEVVSTIRGGIIAPSAVASADVLVWLDALLRCLPAPSGSISPLPGALVSTTHSIVGGVLGWGRGGGWGVANWGTMVRSLPAGSFRPSDGRPVAAGFYFIKHRISTARTGRGAPRRPLLVAGIAWAFTTYLMLKGAGGARSAFGIRPGRWCRRAAHPCRGAPARGPAVEQRRAERQGASIVMFHHPADIRGGALERFYRNESIKC